MDFWLKVFYYTLPAGRVFGVPLRVHWLMLATMPLFVAGYVKAMGATGLALGLMVFAIIYGSVLFHELGHAWGMKLVGSRAEEISITPIGGITRGGGGDLTPRTELIVVGLGPAATALLALWGWIAWYVIGTTGAEVPQFVQVAAGTVFSFNLMLLGINLLVPIFPLDGAKLIRAGLSLKFHPNKVTYYLANVGIVLCILLVLGSAFDIRLPLVGSVGNIMFLLLLLGAMTCWQTLQALQHHNAYSQMDTWGDRVVYHDEEQMRSVKSQLGDWAPRKKAPKTGTYRPSATKQRTEARVVEAIPDPEKVSDPVVLAEMLRAAVDSEDYKLAARIKARVDRLKN